MVSAWKNARGLLTALLIAPAALLAIGVTLEKSAESEEAAAVTGEASESGEAGHSEAEEGHFEETEGDSSVSHSESKETLLGIDTDSPLAVGAGVVLSLVLAGLALRSNNRIVLVVVMLFALAFAILDGKELFHQLDESRTALAVLAGVIACFTWVRPPSPAERRKLFRRHDTWREGSPIVGSPLCRLEA